MTRLRAGAGRRAPGHAGRSARRSGRRRASSTSTTPITARRNGWADAAEYYAVNSSGQFLPRITIPTLVIHSLDDPMIPAGPYRAIDWDVLADHGPVRRAITARGGHVGFHEHGNPLPWYVDRAVRFLSSALLSG